VAEPVGSIDLGAERAGDATRLDRGSGGQTDASEHEHEHEHEYEYE